MRDGSPAKKIIPPGLQQAVELVERLLQVGQVVQHRVAEDEVERLVLERRSASASVWNGGDAVREAERLAERSTTFSMPSEMSVQTTSSITPFCIMFSEK